MKTSAIISVVAVLAAGSAQAIVMPPSCGFNVNDETIVDHGLYDDGVTGFYPQAAGDGVVSSVIGYTGSGSAAIVQHCPSGEYVLLSFASEKIDDILPVYEEMVFGSGSYTMTQIGQALAPLGVTWRTGSDDLGNCACEIAYPDSAGATQ